MTTTTPTPLDALAQQIARQQAELQALRQEYEARQARLTDLNRRKQELAAQLQQVEADIQAVDQGRAPSVPASTSPASQAKPAASTAQPEGASRPGLPALLVEILRQANGPLTASQFVAELVQRKFPTKSKDLARVVQTRMGELVKKGIFRRVAGHGGVILAKRAAGPSTPAPHAAAGPKAESTNSPARTQAAAAGRAPGRQKVPLREILADLLAKTPGLLGARELAEQVLARGYQTNSKSFVDVVQVMLGQIPGVENVRGHGYRLKKRSQAGK